MEHGKTYKSFAELEVWQQSGVLKNDIYALTKSFPDIEKYRLTDQIVRSSRSVCANIAEGYGRYTYKEQIRFCMNARGSLFETHNHLIDATDCGYITSETLQNYVHNIKKIERLLNGYIAWLRKNAETSTTI